MTDWKEITEFFRIVGKLKKLPRSGWLYKVNIEKPESVADHIFRSTLLAMVYGDLKGLDSAKMMRMALLHELPEIITGDLMPEDKTEILKLKEEEYVAVEKILSYLPEDLRESYTKIWEEFESGSSKEARLVRELDKLEMIIQASDYEEEGHDKEKLEEFWTDVKAVIKNPDLKKIYKLLEKRNY